VNITKASKVPNSAKFLTEDNFESTPESLNDSRLLHVTIHDQEEHKERSNVTISDKVKDIKFDTSFLNQKIESRISPN
jgi:hypothetical protein